jgi:hypothetical protein
VKALVSVQIRLATPISNPQQKSFMNGQSRHGLRRFQLQILAYGNCYYIERIARLETVLARKPRVLHIDMIGLGEIPADAALLIRSVLMARSATTRVVTNARNSLVGGSVLVWLLGDSRTIRDDARVFFRRANLPEDDEEEQKDALKGDEPNPWESSDEIDPEEADYARVLELINEFLPVKELAGRLIELPVLRQFGLVENEKVDQFLSKAFQRERDLADDAANVPEQIRIPKNGKTSQSRPTKKQQR